MKCEVLPTKVFSAAVNKRAQVNARSPFQICECVCMSVSSLDVYVFVYLYVYI